MARDNVPHGAASREEYPNTSMTPPPGPIPAAAAPFAEREIIIEALPDEWAEYHGTAAQLVAEGLIPKDFEWPHAAAYKLWEAGGFAYWLRRTRPQGHKGPMRSWLEMDNWFIRVRVVGRDVRWRRLRAIERKSEELRKEMYSLTPAGQREWSAKWDLYCTAIQDKAFQAFKAKLIPQRKRPALSDKTGSGKDSLSP